VNKCPTCHPSRMQMDSSDLDPLDSRESGSKWLLDWFSHFCTAHPCDPNTDRHTDRQTDTQTHAKCNIYINRPHLCTACMRCGLEIPLHQSLGFIQNLASTVANNRKFGSLNKNQQGDLSMNNWPGGSHFS